MIIAPSFMGGVSESPHSLSSRRDRMIVMMIRAYLRHAVFMWYPYPAPERERAIITRNRQVEYLPPGCHRVLSSWRSISVESVCLGLLRGGVDILLNLYIDRYYLVLADPLPSSSPFFAVPILIYQGFTAILRNKPKFPRLTPGANESGIIFVPMPLGVAAGFGFVADLGAFTPLDVFAFDEFFEVLVVRAFGAVEVFLADTGEKVQYNFFRFDVGLFAY